MPDDSQQASAPPPPEPRPADELVPRFYEELRRMAHAYLLREREGHTLGTTGLVHEAYLRLAGQGGLTGIDRNRFFTIAATTLRRILVDHARTRSRKKRGAGVTGIPLEEAEALLTEREADELLALDEALARLAQVNPRGSDVVQHRYFAGLTRGHLRFNGAEDDRPRRSKST